MRTSNRLGHGQITQEDKLIRIIITPTGQQALGRQLSLVKAHEKGQRFDVFTMRLIGGRLEIVLTQA